MSGRAVSPERREAERTALISLFAALGLIIAKVAAGLASNSLAVLSEAAHSTLDAGATALTFFAVRIASRPPDEEHPYGHGKAENISALVETFGLLALSVYIGITAVQRLAEPGEGPDLKWYTFAVIILSIVVDASRASVLRRVGRRLRSAALEADALHFTADLLTSAVVLVGLIFVAIGFPAADAIGGLAIAGYVAFSSISLARKSIDVLMDRAPTGATERIQDVARGVEGVEEVRRVRLRYAGGEPQTDVVIAISRNVPLERAHAVTEEVERAIEQHVPGADVVVHVEPLANEAIVAEKVHAIAAREARVTELHNVYVTLRPEGLHISMHAKFPGTMSLDDAHAIVEHLEGDVMDEIEGVARVDTHIEPLETVNVEGLDVTGLQSTLVAWVKAMAEQEPEVTNCHDVVVTDSEGDLTVVMHCGASPGLTVEEVHTASTRIEDAVHRRWSEVKRVTVHFEPDASGTG